jgi:hypothetical protein
MLENNEVIVDKEQYLIVANYIRGIKGVEEEGNNHQPYFVCKKGVIYFMNEKEHKVFYSKELQFTDNEELNKVLINGLESLLKK